MNPMPEPSTRDPRGIECDGGPYCQSFDHTDGCFAMTQLLASMPEPSEKRTRFVIHVCPSCGFYDADPVLRRTPDSRHGPMRCFPCGKRAVDALDLSRVASSFHATYKERARDSAPLMVATEVVRVD